MSAMKTSIKNDYSVATVLIECDSVAVLWFLFLPLLEPQVHAESNRCSSEAARGGFEARATAVIEDVSSMVII
jgi:hypothetical protein